MVPDYPEPAASEGESLLEVELAGICGTDLALVQGYAGFSGVPGHEFVARVVDAPDLAWIGARVVGEINCGCGKCSACRAGVQEHCPERTVVGIRGRDGAFAERLRLPMRNLHRVPDSVSAEQAVFCEPLAAALRILEQLEERPGRALVLGAGRLGSLVAQVLRGAAGELWCVARSQAKRNILAGFGLSVVPRIEDLPDRAWDLVADCTGSPEGLKLAMGLVRPRGTVVLKSTWNGPSPVDLSPLVIKEVQLLGSRCGPFPAALRALELGEAVVEPLITAEFPLERASEAFEAASAPGSLKILLRP